ncbi:MAG: hypothetical protein ACLSE4_09715 [Clostridium sp.]
MFTALAVIIIFGSGQFSMIAEGSFFIGTLRAMVDCDRLQASGRRSSGCGYFICLSFCGALVSHKFQLC